MRATCQRLLVCGAFHPGYAYTNLAGVSTVVWPSTRRAAARCVLRRVAWCFQASLQKSASKSAGCGGCKQLVAGCIACLLQQLTGSNNGQVPTTCKSQKPVNSKNTQTIQPATQLLKSKAASRRSTSGRAPPAASLDAAWDAGACTHASLYMPDARVLRQIFRPRQPGRHVPAAK